MGGWSIGSNGIQESLFRNREKRLGNREKELGIRDKGSGIRGNGANTRKLKINGFYHVIIEMVINMNNSTNTIWVEWVKRITAIAQNGLAYSKDVYDLERYQQLQTVAAEILQQYSNHDFVELKDFLSSDTGYSTPKIDVRGVIIRDNKILLVKEKLDGKWTLPGGWADVGLSPSENIVKEIYEESGYKTKVLRLLAVYDRDKHPHVPKLPFHVYKLFFLCEITGGSPRKGIETDGVGFFDIKSIPELSITRITPQQIMKMVQLRKKIKTEFD